MEKATAADEAGELMPNLPQEDDAGNVEYKLRLTNLTLEKVRKRTTQMAFRLKVSITVETKPSRKVKALRSIRSVCMIQAK